MKHFAQLVIESFNTHRCRFARLLRAEVRDQVASDAEVGDEIRDLLALART